MITCKICGTLNAPDQQYCDGCGVELDAPVLPPRLPPNPYDLGPRADVDDELEPGDDLEEPRAWPTHADEVIDPEAEAVEAPLVDAGDQVVWPGDDGDPPPAPPAEEPVPPAPAPVPGPGSAAPGTYLVLKRLGNPTAERLDLTPSAARLLVGRFDPSTGPVDLDLGRMAGGESVSRRHAELFFERGGWHVRDLGSTNGVFIKHAGTVHFGPRIAQPTALRDGDEVSFGNVTFTYRDGA